MRIIAELLRVDFRRQWRSLVVLTLLIAISAGIVLAAVAGARRGASAVDRLLDVTLPATAVVSPFQPGFNWDAVRKLPQVEALHTYPGYSGFRIEEAPGYPGSGPKLPFLMADDEGMRTIERPTVLTGRLANPSRADEAVVTANFVQTYGRGVGDTATLRLPTPEQAEENLNGGRNAAPEAGPAVPVRIVGVIRSPWFSDDVGSSGALYPSLGLTNAYRANLSAGDGAPINALVRLRGGEADLAAFQESLTRLTGRPDIDVVSRAAFVAHARDVLGFESASLLAFGLASLVAAAVLIGQAIVRYAASTVTELQVLRALGLTPIQRVAAATAGPLLAAMVGTALGVGCAVVASRWMPFGTAAAYEPAPGLDADWLVLGSGLVLVPALVLAGTAAAAWLALGARPTHWRRSATALAAARAGLPVPVVLGTRFAFEPGGRGALPVRPALIGAVTGVLGVIAAFTFSAGVADAGQHPERFGQTSQLAAVFGFGGQDFAPPAPLLAVLGKDQDVVGVNDIRLAAADSGPTSIPVMSYNPLGERPLVLTSGAPPEAADEVVLAATTAQRLGAGVGSTVSLQGDAGTQVMRLSGVGFVWQTPYNDYDNGAWVTARGYDRLFAGFKQHGALLVLRPGADLSVVLPRLQQAAATVEGGAGLLFLPAFAPRQLGEIRNVQVLPVVLGGFLAMLAIGAVGHALATALRRRRRDVAVLRALGMTRRQSREVVVTQATVLAAVGLLLGIPLGLALGRTLWRVVAESTPMQYVPPVAFWALVLIVPLALAVALLLASVPGRRAARLPVNQILRAE